LKRLCSFLLCIVLTITPLYSQSREDLFKRAFGGAAAPSQLQIETMALVADDDELGNLTVSYQPFGSDFEIAGVDLVKLLSKVQTEEGIQAVVSIQTEKGVVYSKDLAKIGYTFRLSKAAAVLQLDTPPITRQVKVLNVAKKDRESFRKYYPQAAASGFVNLQGRHNIDHFKPETFLSDGYNVDGILNFRENLFRFKGRSMFLRAATDSSQNLIWVWDQLSVFRNDYANGFQYMLGDTDLQPDSFLGNLNVWGAKFATTDFDNRKGNAVVVYRDFSIYLEKDSDIDIVINDVPYRAYRLKAGQQRFQQIPIRQGVNVVEFVLVDPEKGVETQRFRKQYTHDPTILPPGESRFLYQVGVPTEITRNQRVFFSDRFQASVLYRFGLNEAAMLGTFFQGGAGNFIVGVDSRTSLTEGIADLALGVSQVGDSYDLGFRGILTGYRAPQKSTDKLRGWDIAADYYGPKLFGLSRLAFYQMSLGINVTQRLFENDDETDIYGAIQKDKDGETQIRTGTNSRLQLDDKTRAQAGFGIVMDQSGLSPDLSFVFIHTPPREKWNLNGVFRINRQGLEMTFVYKTTDKQEETSTFLSTKAPGFDYTYDDPKHKLRTKTQVRLGDSSLLGTEIDHESAEHSVFASSQLVLNRGFGTRSDVMSYSGNRFAFDYRYIDAMVTPQNENTRVSNVYYGTALVFADGIFTFTKPIRSTFVIINPHKSLSKNKVIVNNRVNTDGFGPLVLHNLTVFNENRVFIDVPDAEIWQDLGQQSFTVNPNDYAGYLIQFGSAGSHIVIFYLVDEKGNRIAFEKATIYPIETEEKMQPKDVIVGRGGDLVGLGLVAGRYVVRFENPKLGNINFSVKEQSLGIINFGRLVHGENNVYLDPPK
jgi:outer membrane usher protein